MHDTVGAKDKNGAFFNYAMKAFVSDPLIPFTITHIQHCGIGNDISVDEKGKERKWEHFAYNVTIECEGRSYTTTYKMGMGHIGTYRPGRASAFNSTDKPGTWTRFQGIRYKNNYDLSQAKAKCLPIPPNIYDISDSLKSDCRCVMNATFSNFCDELGYNTDSIKDREVYFACQKIADEMSKLLRGKFHKWLEDPTHDEMLCEKEES